MKKLLIFTICFFILFGIFTTATFAKTIKIQTPNGEEKELYIPDNYNDLKEAYIEMAKLYLSAEYDVDQSLEKINMLLKMLDQISILFDMSQETNKELSAKLQEVIKRKQRENLFQGYCVAFYQKSPLGQDSNSLLGVGIQLVIKKQALIGVNFSFDTIQLLFGWKIF